VRRMLMLMINIIREKGSLKIREINDGERFLR